MKKTKMLKSKKLNLNKNQIGVLTAAQTNNVAGGGPRTITNPVLCDLQSNNTHIESVCACTRP